MTPLKNPRSYKLLPEHMETVKGVSETVPSETMSIREIITKFTRGQRVDAELRRDGKYEENPTFDSEDLEAASRLQFSDRDEVAERFREKIDAGKADLKRQQESLAAQKLAIKQANQQKKDSEKEKQNQQQPPGSGIFDDRERGATGGKGKREKSGESNDD